MEDLNKRLNSLNGGHTAPKRGRKSVKPWIIRLAIVLTILVVAMILPAKSAYDNAQNLMANAKQVAAAAKTEDLGQVQKALADTKASMKGLNGSLNWFFWLNIVPVLGGYYGDAKHFLQAAEYELEVADSVITTLDPYKNELGLNGQGSGGKDRVTQAVTILDKLLPNLDKIEPMMGKARKEVEGVDVNKYPEFVGSRKVRANLQEAKEMIIGAHIAVSENRQALEIAPDALGMKSPKNYMLLFQNDKELRATGGFLTAYAYLRLDKGKLTTTSSDDIYRLDEKLLKICQNKICPLTPPASLAKYLPEPDGKPRQAWSMRDSNFSPDLPTSAKKFEEIYAMLGEDIKFDGIILIDTQVVEEMIAVTGPINVNGTNYSADNEAKCNCPGVVYELERYAEVAAKGEADRKEVLGTLMQQLMAQALGAGPDKLPQFATTGIRLATDKHVMFYMHDSKVQTALSKLNWTGDIKKVEGDYLHINDSNFAGGKTNLYVEENVVVETSIKDGQVTNKVSIEYKNPQAYNTWLNGIYRDYIRLYVPKGSKLISSKGSDAQVKAADDDALDKTYFDAFIEVRPQNGRTISFEYTLPHKVSGKNYPLLIQKQPGAKDHRYTIKINGKTKSEFDLVTDQQLNLSI